MEEKMINITHSEYKQLLKAALRVEALEGLYKLNGGYISTNDIKVLLGIEIKDGV